MKTIDMLLARFGADPVIPLEAAAGYWRYKPDTLKQKIDGGEIRIPYFSLDENSQKAQRFIHLTDFANFIDERHATETTRFQDQWAEMDQM
ncbi:MULTISPECIES: pyocin activator PrtN family protein [Leisingera]|uniref:pyocin activator PrtN family protein n=1 Tax=Leisingera TaxID=191028 RepID=UPI00068ADB6C|nr:MULTISPECIES: pyocin activator PrtN family protein [Leisingera]UWQ85035.1 pyocin activator PrtN family protein [Leisingera caerulea]